MNEHGIVLSSDTVIRADAVLAVALGCAGHVVVLGDELLGELVVANDDDIGVDHSGPTLGTRESERHVLIVSNATRDLDLNVVVYHHPSHLDPTGQKLDAVAQLRCLRRARL